MIAVDTNVLVQAHRRELPRHAESLACLTRLAEGERPWALPVFVLGEFIRVVTHPRVFVPPSALGEAFDALESLLASPTCRVLMPAGRYAQVFARLCRKGEMRGNRVFDAQIAAVCVEHGVTDVLTFDRDFARLSDVRILAPSDAIREGL